MGTSAGGNIGGNYSWKAESDLSAKQYCGVRLTAANTVGTSYISGTDYVVGILQNKPEAAGSPADVMTSFGEITKVLCSGTIAAGAKFIIGTDAKARAVLAADVAATVFAGDTCEASGASGDIISVIFRPSIGTVS